MMRKIITHNEQQTREAGRKFSEILSAGDIVALYGDLGSGKTQFVKGISSGFGIAEHVTSPTFIVVNEHLDGRLPLYHFDFYRLKSLTELHEIGFEEYLFSSGVCIVEWANVVQQELPANRYNIFFELGTSETERSITIHDKS